MIAGMLEPIRTVGVNAQLSGTLLELKVEEGHRVRQGDVLAEIDRSMVNQCGPGRPTIPG